MEKLYEHHSYNHIPKNVNRIHETEQIMGSRISVLNTNIAVWLTEHVGSMWCAYLFAIMAILGFPPSGSPVSLYIQWTSQTFIQLVLLPTIMVGQNVLGRKQEILAEEQYQTTMKTYHDTEQMINHLDAQDVEILSHTVQISELKNMIASRDDTIAALLDHITSQLDSINKTNEVSIPSESV